MSQDTHILRKFEHTAKQLNGSTRDLLVYCDPSNRQLDYVNSLITT